LLPWLPTGPVPVKAGFENYSPEPPDIAPSAAELWIPFAVSSSGEHTDELQVMTAFGEFSVHHQTID
jgi:hypothetical protein